MSSSVAKVAELRSEDGKVSVPLPLGVTTLGRTNLRLSDKRVSRTQGTFYLFYFIYFITN
jgi:hypothetical protein